MKSIYFLATLTAFVLTISAASAAVPLPRKPGELFEETKVWTIHLRFSPEEWAAMEPKGGPGQPGGGGFGPGMFLAPAILNAADEDTDGKLSELEFRALGAKWFERWDREKTGSVNGEQLRAGLNAVFSPPERPAAGGRGPAMMLQGAEGKRNGLASSMGIEFNYVHADLEFEEQQLKDVAVRFKGNGTFLQSRGSQKRSLKLDLNKFVKGQKLAGITTLNLHNNVTDASWMNEVLSHRLYRDAGVPAPRTAYARVFVTVPGKHERQNLGLYTVVEEIGSAFLEERFGTQKGAIFKPVAPSLFADLGEDWSKYQQTYDAKSELSVKERQRVMDLARLVTKADDAEFAAKAADYLDLDETARYLAVTVWLSTMDSILSVGQNYYLYLRPKTHLFTFLPWDLDHSFGQFPMGGSQEQREQLSIERPWRGGNRFLERLFKLDAFQRRYRAGLEDFSQTIFRPERLSAQVDAIAAAIRPAVQEESEEKLSRFDKAVAGEPVPTVGFGPERPPGGAPPGFGGATKPIKGFVSARAKSVSDQLAGKAQGQTQQEFGGGPGGGGRGRGGAGNFLGGIFMAALDADKDGALTGDEVTQGFGKWFATWSADGSTLTDEQLRAGINKDFAPPRGGPPGLPPAPPQPAGEAPRAQ
jgi:spore coat protein CotH